MSKITEKEYKQYLNIIGLDERDTDYSVEKDDLYYDLYCLTGADKLLPESSRVISSTYEMFLSHLSDPFFYETKTERLEAQKTAFELLNRAANIKVSKEDEDPLIAFHRTNDLLRTILTGLCSVGYLNSFKIFVDNVGIESLIDKMNDKEETDDVRKLYGLLILSRIENVDKEYEMFNMFDAIDLKLLLKVIKNNLENNNVKSYVEPVEVNDDLRYKRLTLRQLKENSNNKYFMNT